MKICRIKNLSIYCELIAEIAAKCNEMSQQAATVGATVANNTADNPDGAFVLGVAAGSALAVEYDSLMRRFEKATLEVLGERSWLGESPLELMQRLSGYEMSELLQIQHNNGILLLP